jgi:hypothetical protein
MTIYANYGAMFPTAELTIASIANGIATTVCGEKINVADIRESRPTSGSPIGIYWNERDAY